MLTPPLGRPVVPPLAAPLRETALPWEEGEQPKPPPPPPEEPAAPPPEGVS